MKIIFLSVLFWGYSLSAFASCPVVEKPTVYIEAQSDVDKKISDFANSKLIATEADQVMTKLLAAKSSVLISWMQTRNLNNSSEEQIIKAWRLYYAQSFVLSKYPHKEAKINSEIEKLVDTTLKKHFTPSFKKKMADLFVQSQKAAVAVVESYKMADASKIIERIKSIQLYWPENLKSARNNSIPLDIIDWSIAYDPAANAINIGLNALMYPNDETFLAVLAHEIGHSFDSCRWSAFFEGAWPFQKIGDCLRGAESVQALKRDDSQMEKLLKSGKISSDVAIGLKANPTCNRLIYPPAGIQADQLPESFADWFAAEVVAQLNLKKLDQLRVDLCEEKKLSEGSSYPTNQNRLEKIYWAHPKLKPGVHIKSRYCSM